MRSLRSSELGGDLRVGLPMCLWGCASTSLMGHSFFARREGLHAIVSILLGCGFSMVLRRTSRSRRDNNLSCVELELALLSRATFKFLLAVPCFLVGFRVVSLILCSFIISIQHGLSLRCGITQLLVLVMLEKIYLFFALRSLHTKRSSERQSMHTKRSSERQSIHRTRPQKNVKRGEEVVRLKEELEAAHQRVEESNREIAKHRAQIAQLNEEVKKQEEEKTELDQRIGELVATGTERGKEVVRLKEELEAAHQRVEEIKKTLEERIGQLRQQKEDLEEQIATLEEKFTEQKTLLTKRTQDLVFYSELSDQQVAVLGERAEELILARKDIERVKGELALAQKEIVRLEGKVACHEEEKQELMQSEVEAEEKTLAEQWRRSTRRVLKATDSVGQQEKKRREIQQESRGPVETFVSFVSSAAEEKLCNDQPQDRPQETESARRAQSARRTQMAVARTTGLFERGEIVHIVKADGQSSEPQNAHAPA